MTTESKTSSGDAASSKAASKEARKLSEDFKPNEPSTNTGVDEKGVPDGTLGPQQLERAANEGLLSLRPQPTREQIEVVLRKVNAKNEKGFPAIKCKTAKEAAEKAISLLNEDK
jgi:hypothetical protein